MEDFLAREIERQSPDIIVYLGDAANHDIMNQRKETHLRSSAFIADRLRSKYPSLGMVYPVVGNHEGLPAGDYDVWSNYSTWIQYGLADLWKQWLTPDCIYIYIYI